MHPTTPAVTLPSGALPGASRFPIRGMMTAEALISSATAQIVRAGVPVLTRPRISRPTGERELWRAASRSTASCSLPACAGSTTCRSTAVPLTAGSSRIERTSGASAARSVGTSNRAKSGPPPPPDRGTIRTCILASRSTVAATFPEKRFRSSPWSRTPITIRSAPVPDAAASIRSGTGVLSYSATTTSTGIPCRRTRSSIRRSGSSVGRGPAETRAWKRTTSRTPGTSPIRSAATAEARERSVGMSTFVNINFASHNPVPV